MDQSGQNHLVGYVHRFPYHAPLDEDEPLAPFKVRDGAAFGEILGILIARMSLGYGELQLNYPATYQINEQALEKLKFDGMDGETREELESMKNEPPMMRAKFWAAVKRRITENKLEIRGESILNRAIIEAPIDTSFLRPTDYLVHTTRPFLNDREGTPKPGEQSNTTLEQREFKELRKYIEICSRLHVHLSLHMAKELDKAAIKRRDSSAHKACIEFYVNAPNRHNDADLRRTEASFHKYKRRDDNVWRPAGEAERRKTAVYLLHAENVLDNGANLVVAWGMSGMATLAWCYLLRHARETKTGRELSSLFDQSVFVMAEMTMGLIPERPPNLSFINEDNGWQLDILLEHKIT